MSYYAYCCPSSWHATVSLFTSSLSLESNPASLCRLCFSATPSRRSRDGSSLNARPMLTGLGPPAASSPSSEPNLPRLVRFSDRSLLRDEHGRPGKRARAGARVLKPATVAGDDNPPPDAAIIYYNNTDGALAEGDSSDMRARWTAPRQRREIERNHRCIMGKRTSPDQHALASRHWATSLVKNSSLALRCECFDNYCVRIENCVSKRHIMIVPVVEEGIRSCI